MQALQHHYTSCRRGQSGHAGFQTRATSPGLRPDEQREIERRGVYRPPRDAPQEPSAEEIARDFPKALRFARLESGRWALTRSCYTGRDYSGRWGNFFAHSLVVEDGRMPPLWPVDYFEWQGWREGLDPREDTDDAPAPLPTVDLGEIPPAESFSLDEIQAFLGEEPGRPELLARMARAALLARETSRAVVIRDQPIQGLYWIAAVQKLFPPAHALELGFSTYQDDPRGCAILNATTGETDFAFDDAERRYRFFMFDLDTGEHSEVPGEDEDYARIATRWLVEEPRKLERFFEFMGLFDHRQLTPDLVHAARLFELSEGEDDALFDAGRAAEVTAFASRHATLEGRFELFELIARAGAKAAGQLDPEDHLCLVRFLADGAEAMGQPRARRQAFAAWWARFHDPARLGEGGLESLAAGWKVLRERLASHIVELSELLLAEETWSELRPRLAALPPEAALVLLRVTWECLGHARRSHTRRSAPVASPEVEAIVDALVHGGAAEREIVRGVLEVARDDAEALAAFARRLADARHGEAERAWRCEVGRVLGEVLSSLAPGQADAVRRRLDDEAIRDVLFGEWLAIRDRKGDPAAAFRDYRREVLDVLPGYGEQCRGWVASSALDPLAPERQAAFAVELLRGAEVDRFPEKLAQRCIGLANDALSLASRDEEHDEVAVLVAEAAGRHDVALMPDRPLLRQILRAVQVASLAFKDLRLEETARALADLDSAEYRTFLTGYLMPALGSVDNRRQHGQILLATLRREHLKIYRKAYLSFFKDQRGAGWTRALRSALYFWLWFDPGDAELRDLEPLEETARDGLELALAKLREKHLKGVEQSLRKMRLAKRGVVRWEEIREGVRNRKRSLLSRVMRRLRLTK